MSRKFALFISLIFFSQIFFVLSTKSNPEHFPPAAVVGRYVLQEDRYWIAYNKTVQQLRDEGYDVPGDPDWPLQVNYTRLNFTLKCTILRLSWPNVTSQNIEGEYGLNVTAYRIMEDGSIGEKLASFVRVNQPPHMRTWESWDPNLGPMFNPSVFVIGNNFSINDFEYNVNRTEILTNTPWGQNETYVLCGYFSNTSHCWKTIVWCDAESGIRLKQNWDLKTPMFISHEELKIVETGTKFEVVHDGEIYEIPIDTNSTIKEIAYDSAAKKICLTVEGSTGTLGICNITIPKELMPADHDIEVYINGQKTDYQLTEDADNYYVYVEYQHSTHTITISFVIFVIWVQWWFWAIVAAGIVVSAGAVYLKKRKPSSPNASSLPSEKTGTSIK